jgi:hypothetical protein
VEVSGREGVKGDDSEERDGGCAGVDSQRLEAGVLADFQDL